MTNPNPVAICVLCSVALACGREAPLTETGTPKPAVAVSPPPKPAPRPLTDTDTRLPDGFTGDDIHRVYASLKSGGKSEFETTDAYRKRLGDEARSIVYSFLVQPRRAQYDADRGEVVLQLRVKVDPSTTDVNEDSITIPADSKEERSTFPASNALGVKVDVQRTTETDYGLAAVKVPAEIIGRRVPGAMYEYYERFFEVPVPMSPDDARQRKDALRFLFRAHPSAVTKARTFEDSYEWKATINSPTSRVTQSYAAYVDVGAFAVWVVDPSRGDVLTKTSVAELLKTNRHAPPKLPR
jgi:hypothetical protein